MINRHGIKWDSKGLISEDRGGRQNYAQDNFEYIPPGFEKNPITGAVEPIAIKPVVNDSGSDNDNNPVGRENTWGGLDNTNEIRGVSEQGGPYGDMPGGLHSYGDKVYDTKVNYGNLAKKAALGIVGAQLGPIGQIGAKKLGKNIGPVTTKTLIDYETTPTSHIRTTPTITPTNNNDYSGGGRDHAAHSQNASKEVQQDQAATDANRAAARGGNDSSGNSGGKIVCTAMNKDYGFGSFRNAIWLKFSKTMTKEHEIGYHAIFKPLLSIRNKWYGKHIYSVLKHIARHRTADLRAVMQNKQRDNLGRAYRLILEPLCYVVGKIKGDK